MGDHILYELNCGEITFGEFDDVKKLMARCLKHGDKDWIIRVVVSEWYASCNQCRKWRRWCGLDKRLAQINAQKHWRLHPQHNPLIGRKDRRLSKMAQLDHRKRVAEMEWVWYNGRVIVPGNKSQELPDEPPF